MRKSICILLLFISGFYVSAQDMYVCMLVVNPYSNYTDTIIFNRIDGVLDIKTANFKEKIKTNLNQENVKESYIVLFKDNRWQMHEGYTFVPKDEPSKLMGYIHGDEISSYVALKSKSKDEADFIYAISDSSYFACRWNGKKWAVSKRVLIPLGLFIPEHYSDTSKIIILSARNFYNEKKEIINTVYFLGKFGIETHTGDEVIIPLGFNYFLRLYDQLPPEERWIWNEKLKVIETLEPEMVKARYKDK